MPRLFATILTLVWLVFMVEVTCIILAQSCYANDERQPAQPERVEPDRGSARLAETLVIMKEFDLDHDYEGLLLLHFMQDEDEFLRLDVD